MIRILEILVAHGADEDILVEAHPHVGSNRLPKIIQNMRQTLLNCGGEIRFESRVTDFIVAHGCIRGVRLENGQMVAADAVVLCPGHSARDLYMLLRAKNLRLSPKPLAVGVRMEHPQHLIDKLQYHQDR